MIHYTTIPLEMVYEGYDDFKPTYEEIDYEGVQMMVEPTGPNQARIVRLLSADPQDFLNPHYEPGTMIRFQPKRKDN